MHTSDGPTGSRTRSEPEAGQRPPLKSDFAIKTWRYLRLSMVLLVVGLAASVVFERSKVGCFQTSISAYYYTPVRGYLVGALVAIGTCLVCLRGSTDRENVFLNLAGMFAPIVALVPTPDKGSCAASVPFMEDRGANIANNVFALLLVGAIALIIAAVLTAQNKASRPAVVAICLAVLTWVLTALVFWLDRHLFVHDAHYVAAVLMFICVVLVVCSNALGYRRKTKASTLRNRYAAIAAAMIGSSLFIGIAALLGWDHWLIAIETALISLFAAFWVLQTVELWGDGLRPGD